jgi:hypothetical protein
LEGLLKAYPPAVTSILSYTDESTGGQVLKHFLKSLSPATIQREQCELGQELSYIASRLSSPSASEQQPTNANASDMVLTCDALAVRVASHHSFTSTHMPPHYLPFHKLGDPYNCTLFTGLVVNSTFLKDNKNVVVDVLDCLQGILHEFHSSNQQTGEELAHFLAWDDRISRTVGPPGIGAFSYDTVPVKTQRDASETNGSMAACQSVSDANDPILIHCQPQELFKSATAVVSDLKELIPKNLRLRRTEWMNAAKIWDFTPTDAGTYYRRCCRRRIGLSVSFWAWPFRFRRWLRRNVHITRYIFDLLATIGAVGAFWRLPLLPEKWQHNNLLLIKTIAIVYFLVGLLRWLRFIP